MLGRYESAVGDIKKCLDINIKDYEAKLLLCFYLYALLAFEEALELLNDTMENDANSSPKIKTFINTLHFRIKDYEHAGVIGLVLRCIF
jgi:tetratricopeptide (TPR) repeat protein